MMCTSSVLCLFLATVGWIGTETGEALKVDDESIARLGRTSKPLHLNFSSLHFPSYNLSLLHLPHFHFNFSGLHLNLSALEHLHLSHPITLHGNATDHWCCNVATTKKIIQSHSTLIYTKQIKDRVSHHHCGFLGTSRCARHHYYYVSVPAYKTTYTSRTIQTTCPAKNLVCCKGYLLVAENCIPLSALPEIKEDLIRLHNANIPVGR